MEDSPRISVRSTCVKLVPLLALLVVSGCTQSPPPAAAVVRPIKTMVVAPGGDAQVRVLSGTVEASKRVELAFQVSGLLTKLPVKEGQEVAKGELIAQLRPDEFQARLDSLQAQLDQARATLTALRTGERREEQLRRESQVRQARARLANANAEMERNRPLAQTRVITASEFEVLETRYQVAKEDYESALQMLEKGTVGRQEDIMAQEAMVRGLEAQVVEANIGLQDSTLSAPYDGVIAQRFVEEGQNVRAKDPVVRFQDVDEIEIVIDVPEVVMAVDIRTSDVVQVVAELSSAPGIEFPLRISEIAQVADPTTQTFRVRAAMQAPEGIRALPGMTARVTMTFRRAEILGERLLVPIAAVVKNAAGEQAVWVIGADSAVTRRPVKLGEPTGGQVEIIEGLQSGDRIAVAGATLLREGTKVRDLGEALGGAGL
jgi:RND family efflux transporter MFP subunit